MEVFVCPIRAAAAKTVTSTLVLIRDLLCSLIFFSFGVLFLDTTGILYHISQIMAPFTAFWDLPGEAALVFIISIFSNVYAAIGVIHVLDLSLREITILAAMCFIAHNFFVEGPAMKKTGASLVKLILLRFLGALVVGWILSCILPDPLGVKGYSPALPKSGGLTLDRLLPALIPWLISTALLAFKIGLMLFGIMFIQKLLEECNVRQILGKILVPLMILLGLAPSIGYVWIVANLAGVVYSSDILQEEVRSGAVSESEADVFNQHIAFHHGQLGEIVPFILILDVPYLWSALPGFILACIMIWLKRGQIALFRRAFRVKIESD
jgi:hypothetical protein